ncbi:MAG: ABC transporter ATP-binding protein [Nitrospinota bacterium]
MQTPFDMIVLDRVTKVYDRARTGGILRDSAGLTVLRNITFSVAPGEFVTLMGPSGCGKSTLLNLVAGIDRPSAGQVFVAGLCVSALSERDLTRYRRECVGVVYQFFHLLPTLTAAENVTLPLLLRGLALREASEQVMEMLDRVGLANRADHLPSELSGGELQRVALARAVVHRPRVLLADEPTGNLDSAMGEELIGHLRSLARQEELTILLATHSQEIAAQGDRIVAMRDGALQDPRTLGAPSDGGMERT